METRVTEKAIQHLKIGKHDLKLEASVLQRRAVLELDYSTKLREWARTMRSHIQANDVQDLKEVRKTFMLLANEADSESNKHYKVFNDISRNFNGPYHRILRFREMNYHKEDNGRGCREINFYEEEFKKLLISYQQVNGKFEKWKLRLSELKKSTQGSRPWFLRPSHKAISNRLEYTEKKYNLHQHREREERKALLQNTTRLLDEMRDQEKKRLTMLVSQFKAYLRILRQNHQESFDRRESLQTIESHLDNMNLDEILENWSADYRKTADDVKDDGDGCVTVKTKVKGFGYDIVHVGDSSSQKLVDDTSEQSSSDTVMDLVEESGGPHNKDGIPLKESQEDIGLNVEKVEMSDADELGDIEFCGRPLNLRKESEDLITQSSTLGLQNKGYATAGTEDDEVITLGPVTKGARTSNWVMRQTPGLAWDPPSHQPTPVDDVRQTKSSKDHHSPRNNGATTVTLTGTLSDQDVRKSRYRTSVALDTLGVGTNVVETVPFNQSKEVNEAEYPLHVPGRTYSTPQEVKSLHDYKAKAPTELSFGKGRSLAMVVGKNEAGMAYGFKITNTGKKKWGYFPFNLVDIV